MENRLYYELGLIGYPLGHSLSPALHQAALEACGLAGAYRLYSIAPSEAGEREIELLLGRVRVGDVQGLNVTIPHKQNVQKFLDRLTPTAEAVGAVNTIFLDRQGQLVGENTDVPGFLRDVSRLVSAEKGAAVVLGAGGSARAVVHALAQSGWEVRILARRAGQAEALARAAAGGGEQRHISTGPLEREALEAALRDCRLLVNTTPVGMYPKPDACPWPEDIPLPARCAVYDLVYNPLETRLLHRARQAGLAASNGAGMLVAQAALAFALWTGQEPPFEVMQKAFPTRLDILS
jgi:shikimate dehydrogenase